MNITYKIYNPSGNITALVIGDKYSQKEKIKINNIIMKKEKKVEQVGFISLEKMKLSMAGGEFCGNASRCAIKYYLDKNKKDTAKIEINDYTIKGGKDNNEIWCEIPIMKKTKLVEKLSNQITQVNLSGITILLLDYNKKFELKNKTMELIKQYKLYEKEAVGVIFKDKEEKIIPVVWVKSINTLFEENACGSGTIAYAISETLKFGKKNLI